MTSLLRQIVAGPRAKHAETGLDLCYVTSNIIATSGPSQAYPQRAYRNPLDRLVAFLDSQHGEKWAIWEFRAEGTGYPDDAVYHRIRHYPWPDHHPPPFRLVPMIMASMRNWVTGGELGGAIKMGEFKAGESSKLDEMGKNGRVVVVHCKAGKGRSGTMACSFLISQCGWTIEDALARFTERRMRPNFGPGVSIPSQLRWIHYVDRWNKGGRKYVDREIEIVELHVWGLRHGVKVSVEGFLDEGKKIHVFHTFKASERYIVQGDAPGGNGVMDLVYDMAGYAINPPSLDPETAEDTDQSGPGDKDGAAEAEAGVATTKDSQMPDRNKSKRLINSKTTTSLMRKFSKKRPKDEDEKANLHPASAGFAAAAGPKSKTVDLSEASSGTSSSGSGMNNSFKPASDTSLPRARTFADKDEPGGQAVIFKPQEPIRIPNGDVNVSVERRNRAPASMGLTMVTAVAHVWFNTFFEGNGPEQDGKADDHGVFEIEWDRMDGIKGSSQKGTRAADRIAVVWRVVGSTTTTHTANADKGSAAVPAAAPEVHVSEEPKDGESVPQMKAADWKGNNKEDPEAEKRLGLRTETPSSAEVSKASSIKSQVGDDDDEDDKGGRRQEGGEGWVKEVKTSGPEGGKLKGRSRSPSLAKAGEVS